MSVSVREKLLVCAGPVGGSVAAGRTLLLLEAIFLLDFCLQQESIWLIFRLNYDARVFSAIIGL